MRPKLNLLDKNLIENIISEAYELLINLGIEICNSQAKNILYEHKADVDKSNLIVKFTRDLIDNALSNASSEFKLFDVFGNQTHHFKDYNVYFTPGSAALLFLDPEINSVRSPDTNDYIKYSKIIDNLKNIASQSTAFIPSDVTENISDSYRLFLSLLYCSKPIVTGCFKKESFEIMKNFQLVIRGNENELKHKPLTIFSVCPTSPLKWGDITTQNLMDCAKYSIPVEFISMPLSGFLAPVTIVGTLIQHTAETLCGIVISQLVNPGTPFLYGGSPAVFDVRNETTPMGAVETMMIDCAYNEIAKYLGFPSQAYISLSDAKLFDAQAGMESSMGATLAALSGINNISGPGMMDFENCFSLEKLVFDNEICGMALRLIKGIEPKDDFPSIPIFQELLNDSHLLISSHTLKHIKTEIHNPSYVINRSNRERWVENNSPDVNSLAKNEIERILEKKDSYILEKEKKKELFKLMTAESSKFGMKNLPVNYEDY